jgi:transcriptional regulator with XRE-family HTH domain
MNVIKSFGDKIKLLRLEKGYSQEELASRAGIDRTYISDIEKGERNVSLKIIEKLALSLDKEIFELFKK